MLNMTWMQGCAKTRYPAIFKTRTGYRVRVRAVDPRTGTMKEANREYDNIDLREALLHQGAMREEIHRLSGLRQQRVEAPTIDVPSGRLVPVDQRIPEHHGAFP